MAAPTSTERQHYALQTIFSFFLGLMVLAFVGVGVNTFYPSPSQQHQEEQRQISRQMETINMQRGEGKSLDATQQAEFDRLAAEQGRLSDVIAAEEKPWARNTSIVLVIFATLVMGVSLVLSEQLRVISNGLLLGGLFTMVYGVGWVIFSGNSAARFVVIAFALIVAIGLGYAKFVRERTAGAAAPATGAGPLGTAAAADAGELARVEARLAALERRAAAAAAALGDADERGE